jgi:hypothetical protein
MNPRTKPAHRVRVDKAHTVIVSVTVCTRRRRPWLASPENHVALCLAWEAASTWLVGRYVLMPDHLHVFASPGRQEISLDNWVRFWKSRFTRTRCIASQECRRIIGIRHCVPASRMTGSGFTFVTIPCVPDWSGITTNGYTKAS